MTMTLTGDVDATTTNLPVSEGPPRWTTYPVLAYLPNPDPPGTFELVRVTAFGSDALTVSRGVLEITEDPPTPIGNSAHAAGTVVTLGQPTDRPGKNATVAVRTGP